MIENQLDAVLPQYESSYLQYSDDADKFMGDGNLQNNLDDMPMREQVYKQTSTIDNEVQKLNGKLGEI